ncbi:hypothetical protein Syun_026276 [Stephania yunnanensis]|uniref:Uncharacterized protein n=1 Tax=Stephania yunnanensis TaxID=152371 RepID=A0AAP0ET69_9MAGN
MVKIVFYGEYQCTGPGASTSKRAKYTKVLSNGEAKPYLYKSYINAATHCKKTANQKWNFPSLICKNSVSNCNQKRNRDGINSVSENVVADSIRNGKLIPFLIRDGIETE